MTQEEKDNLMTMLLSSDIENHELASRIIHDILKDVGVNNSGELLGVITAARIKTGDPLEFYPEAKPTWDWAGFWRHNLAESKITELKTLYKRILELEKKFMDWVTIQYKKEEELYKAALYDRGTKEKSTGNVVLPGQTGCSLS